jgi:hypothetical protein
MICALATPCVALIAGYAGICGGLEIVEGIRSIPIKEEKKPSPALRITGCLLETVSNTFLIASAGLISSVAATAIFYHSDINYVIQILKGFCVWVPVAALAAVGSGVGHTWQEMAPD